MAIGTKLASTAAVAATAVIGGLASRPAQSSWYENLRKPRYQPPRQAFPIVWPILYTDIAVTSATALDALAARGETTQRRAYLAALVGNLALNAGWSWIFFSRRKLGTAALAAGALTVSSADLTRRATRVNGAKAAPLGLYPLWCAFATVLSTHIWVLNRRR
ncbi:tryptophan-rich sensory protein [Mycolicibacterium canariasense]|uniref:Tryptophan-rich sensory protein n=1 Tax=Mycolicibacterium canariasense TaxID=228230 RepID=A0A100WEW5_MYCCR|nr:TspO/MBR family protein [Mycolicibacterium canariasense]MCV7211201.1 tryptophan-rich sensory protein [Mycolicibacterium canariasense]ORV03334.1 TspO protein [Mycolicibacterium canariasense]GAS97229.1 tryptophan-rich sensory protein [Mycolicibacterium canariasense]